MNYLVSQTEMPNVSLSHCITVTSWRAEFWAHSAHSNWRFPLSNTCEANVIRLHCSWKQNRWCTQSSQKSMCLFSSLTLQCGSIRSTWHAAYFSLYMRQIKTSRKDYSQHYKMVRHHVRHKYISLSDKIIANFSWSSPYIIKQSAHYMLYKHVGNVGLISCVAKQCIVIVF